MQFRGGKFVDEGERVAKAIRKAGYFALRKLGFLVRGQAKSEIEEEKGPSPAGSPPHTHKHVTTKSGREGKQGLLPASILYAIEKDPARVLIGPSVNVVGTVGAAFEHEGEAEYKVREYPPRRFMGPALEAEEGQLPGLLATEMKHV
jgi:hypothetical protein